MSPEELEATREGANVDYAPDIAYEDWQAMARALLAHIDSQAVTINNLAAALDEAKVDQVNFSSACQEELDTQASQISLLKEKLVESQAAINSLSLPLGMDPIDLGIDWSEGELEAARQQLKAEMPGVKWE